MGTSTCIYVSRYQIFVPDALNRKACKRCGKCAQRVSPFLHSGRSCLGGKRLQINTSRKYLWLIFHTKGEKIIGFPLV